MGGMWSTEREEQLVAHADHPVEGFVRHSEGRLRDEPCLRRQFQFIELAERDPMQETRVVQ
jgi:hypothetical protein